MGTITVSGLGSGLTYDVWIEELVAVKQASIDNVSKQISSIKSQENALNTIESAFTKLQTTISTLANTNSTSSVFSQKTATSNSDAITVTADSTASAQDIKVSVTSLATATTAKAASAVAANVNSSTLISNVAEGAVNAGTFSVYVGGVKNTITIASDDTIGGVLEDLNAISGVSASLTDGKLTITKSGATTVTVGSTSDTSNFSKVMSLTRDSGTGAYTSSKSIFSTNTSTALTGTTFASGSVTEGTFKIGNAEFTINATTTLKSLISNINNDEDAGAIAYWDSNAGKLVLTATDQGATNINIEAGTSNFTDIMGLTSGGNIIQDAQTLGTNAVLTINGTSITSSSNTITNDISGLKGVTLTLKDETTSEATINVTNDVTAAITAITNAVSAFNMAVSNTKDATAADGKLYGQSVLSMISSNIRKTATAAVSFDNEYKTLASIGITTGEIGTSTDADTSQLKIDKDKLTAALQNDPTAVMNLLVGNDVLKTNGVFTKISTALDNSLDANNGYFTTQEKSFDKQISNLDKKVTKMTTDLTKYQTQLEAKFQAMDSLISGLQNSQNIFNSYFNNKKNSDS